MSDEELDTGTEGVHCTMQAYASDYTRQESDAVVNATLHFNFCRDCRQYHDRSQCPQAGSMGSDGMVSIHLYEETYLKSNRHAVVFLGSAGVGKTSLFRAYLRSMKAEIAPEFRSSINVPGYGVASLHVLDTAEQEKFLSLTSRCEICSYYRKAKGCLLVFNSARRETFLDLTHWVREVKGRCEPDVLIFLIDRVSTRDRRTAVSDSEVDGFMQKHEIPRKYVTRTGEKRQPSEKHIKSIIREMLDELLGVKRLLLSHSPKNSLRLEKQELPKGTQSCCE